MHDSSLLFIIEEVMTKTVLFLFCQLTLYSPLAIFVIFTCITHVVIYVKIWIILVNDIFQNACNYESFEDIILKFGSMM